MFHRVIHRIPINNRNKNKRCEKMSEKSYPLEITSLEEKIGYNFKKTQLVITALTHSSYSNEMRSKCEGVVCNERMEFLGDSVLSIITSEYIFEKYTQLPEGELTKIRANTVCENALFEYSKKLELGNYMYLGHGEERSGGRGHKAILADAFEALLAAIYLDGGMKNAREFLLPYISEKIEKLMKEGRREDYKSLLQQFVQRGHGDILEYIQTGEEGPAHDKRFYFEVKLNNNTIGRGNGSTKREAEQMAAREALILFGELPEN